MANPSKKSLSYRGASSISSFNAGFGWLVVGTLMLSGCGFTPIHKFDGTQSPLMVAALSVDGDAIERSLRRSLSRRVTISTKATARVDIKTSRQLIEVQRGADGIARRYEVRHSAHVTVTQDAAHNRGGETKMMSLTQYMDRGTNAADEMAQLRSLDELAAREISRRVSDYLAIALKSRDAATPPAAKTSTP